MADLLMIDCLVLLNYIIAFDIISSYYESRPQ